MSTFTDRLKELKLDSNTTQKQISDYIGVTDRNYRNYETGETDPTAKVLIKIADFYNVSLDYLVGRSDIREKR